MSEHRSALPLAFLLVASLSTATAAQSKVCVDQVAAGTRCCGQYACAESESAAAARSDSHLTAQEPNPDSPILRIAERTLLAERLQQRPTSLAGDRHHD
jgi:hypothetical protein